MPRAGASAEPSRAIVRSERTLLLGLMLLICCLYSLLARDTYGGDFRAYYVAAQASHAGLDPYMNQVNVDERYADRDWLQVNSRFIYPPSSLFLFTPLSRLPYRYAKVLFSTSMALIMVWVLLRLRDQYPRTGWVAIGLLLSLPMAANIDNGQVDILILGLTLAAFWAKRPWLGGACLGLAIAIKVAPALVLLWLFATRRWRHAAWTIAAAGFMTAVAVRIWGMALHREFMRHLGTHLGTNPAMLQHTFTTFKVIYGRFVLMGTDSYSLHYFYGTRQNPLLYLNRLAAPAGLAMVLAYLLWMLLRRRDLLTSDTGFYTFLVVALFANGLLWPAGLVACYPLTMLIVHRSQRPVTHGLAMLLPFFVPIEFVADRRFICWLVITGVCVWQSLREGRRMGSTPAPLPVESLA